jgi:hypothetical protein
LRALAAFLIALGAVDLVTGYFGVGTPVKVAGLLVAVVVGVWLYRAERSSTTITPTVQELVALASFAVAIGFALAYFEERSGHHNRYDLVVVPRKQVAVEYAAPSPHTEVANTSLFSYGDHVQVKCYVRGKNGSTWYQLADDNFMSDQDLAPAPLSRGDPPEC